MATLVNACDPMVGTSNFSNYSCWLDQESSLLIAILSDKDLIIPSFRLEVEVQKLYEDKAKFL